MRIYLFIITFFLTLGTYAQQQEIDFDAVDSLYREDQFYLNITYNALQKRPDGIKQNKLSPGIAFGFLRDIPINKKELLLLLRVLGIRYQFTIKIYKLQKGQELMLIRFQTRLHRFLRTNYHFILSTCQ